MAHDHSEIEVSVVIPCLNEAKTIGTCIQKALDAMSFHSVLGEVVVADNGSEDGSQAIAEGMGARVVSINRKGYGAALSGGMQAARGTFIIMGDADDSYDFSAIFPFIVKMREGYDLVMGCRLPRGGGTIMPGAMPWKHRWIGVPFLSGVGKLLFRCPITDFHCGLRGLTREAFERMELITPGMEFASEMIIKATLMGLTITELPITLHKDGRGRKPHLRSFRDGWRHLRFMVCYKFGVR
jgi:glycosyltransferase involved in cell wall biosynthesis